MTGQSTAASITPTSSSAPLHGAWRPQRMALVRRGRLLKRWRYVGVFCEELLACAAQVWVGPARQCFWALYERCGGDGRAPGALRQGTHMLRGGRAVALSPGALRVRDGGVALELCLAEGAPVCARCHNGGAEVWTRKQAGVAAQGTLALDGGAPRALRALAVIDDSAGYHPRVTEWFWSAGAGRGADGADVAWNLVSGINDPASGSERALWLDGRPHECPPVRFDSELREISAVGGARLFFSAEAQRSRSDNLLVVRSDYHARFGRFCGTLPAPAGFAPIALSDGLGVIEHHRALW